MMGKTAFRLIKQKRCLWHKERIRTFGALLAHTRFPVVRLSSSLAIQSGAASQNLVIDGDRLHGVSCFITELSVVTRQLPIAMVGNLEYNGARGHECHAIGYKFAEKDSQLWQRDYRLSVVLLRRHINRTFQRIHDEPLGFELFESSA